jgi:uncharacterized membrane protein
VADDEAHSTTQLPDAPLGLERVIFFSDAVFAIVITLFVLPLAVEVNLPDGPGGLAGRVFALWPRVMTFVISFLVVGQFWVAHHRIFNVVRRFDRRLIWFNLITLLLVAFMLFPAAVLGSHSTARDHFAVTFYAAAMTAASIAMSATWLYANRASLVTVDAATARVLDMRAVATSVVFALSVLMAWLLGLVAAVLCWLVLLPLARTAITETLLRRGAGRG